MKILDIVIGLLRAAASGTRARAGELLKPRRSRGSSTPGSDLPESGRLAAERSAARQLEAATDPESVRKIFQRYLRRVDGEPLRVRECRISFVRHRDDVRRMLHYTLHVVAPGTGREWTQLVTGSTYGRGRTRQVYEQRRRQNSDPVAPGASPFAEPFFYVSELDMLMQVFPYDQRLPALRHLVSGPGPVLEEVLRAHCGSGDWRRAAWEVRPVRYRVGLRATLRLTARALDCATGRAIEGRFYAKIYRHHEEGERTYGALRSLQERETARREGFAVPTAVAYLDAQQTLVQAEVPGTSLQSILRGGGDPTLVVRNVARALADLHLADPVTSRRRHPEKEVARLRYAGELLRTARPSLEPRIRKIVGAAVAGFREGAPAPTHGDFKPAHVLVDGERLFLLDLDGFAGADPMLDVANFLTSIAITPLRSRRPLDRRSRTIGRPFVEEYFAHVPETWRESLPHHYAGSMLRKAAGFHRGRDPDWSHKASLLIEEAERSLAGDVW